MIHYGDCLEVMAGFEPESVDAVVTDPPYGLEFMGKQWDKLIRTNDRPGKTARFTGGRTIEAYKAGKPAQEWHEAWAREAYRVAKPSAYLLAFGGTRTVHRLASAIEDAGWIIRDMLVWAYASGFPKSKASLKPAWEPIVMARKPGPLRELAIDRCRIGFASDEDRDGAVALQNLRTKHPGGAPTYGGGKGMPPPTEVGVNPAGRWPANVILTDPIFDGGWDGVVGGGDAGPAGVAVNRNRPAERSRYEATGYEIRLGPGPDQTYGDSGTYSRFFLIPKADRTDREPVLGGLIEARAPTLGISNVDDWTNGSGKPGKPPRPRANGHPTVKPTELMRHLVRLVTPTGGTVLDPFLGSGSTAIAAEMEGFPWIGIEKEAEYVAIAEARLNGVQQGLGLPA